MVPSSQSYLSLSDMPGTEVVHKYNFYRTSGQIRGTENQWPKASQPVRSNTNPKTSASWFNHHHFLHEALLSHGTHLYRQNPSRFCGCVPCPQVIFSLECVLNSCDFCVGWSVWPWMLSNVRIRGQKSTGALRLIGEEHTALQQRNGCHVHGFKENGRRERMQGTVTVSINI